MAAISDVVITSRVPINQYWMVSGYGTANSDCFVTRGNLGFRKVLAVVSVNGRSTTVTENITSAVINSNDGTENTSDGELWFNNATGVIVDFCVIGR